MLQGIALPSARTLSIPDSKAHAAERRVTWLASSPGLQLALSTSFLPLALKLLEGALLKTPGGTRD